MSSLEIFCRQVRSRSQEHASAIGILFRNNNLGVVVSILRQELDSMVRTIYLLSLNNRLERTRLIEASVNGAKWTVRGKKAPITDKEMVELATTLHGWTSSVYRFGCAFIHLSDFHDYSDRDPFRSLPLKERKEILDHMRSYHGGPTGDNPSFSDLSDYFPAVFEKVASNLECYLKKLESNGDLDS